jgi:hypothetical protein
MLYVRQRRLHFCDDEILAQRACCSALLEALGESSITALRECVQVSSPTSLAKATHLFALGDVTGQ